MEGRWKRITSVRYIHSKVHLSNESCERHCIYSHPQTPTPRLDMNSFEEPYSLDHAHRRIRLAVSNHEMESAKQILLYSIAKWPEHTELRTQLRSYCHFNRVVVSRFPEQFRKTVYETSLEAASKGWSYSTNQESLYLERSDELFDRHEAKGFCLSMPTSISKSSATMISETYKRLESRRSPSELYDQLVNLTESLNCVIVGDDSRFVDPPEPLSAVNQQCFRVMVFGAGCVGLAMATGYKSLLGSEVSVAIVENRIQANHVKMNYSRNWLTHIRLSCLDGLLPKAWMSIIARLGRDGFVGVPLRILETVFLLAARQTGVNVSFTPSNANRLIANHKPDLLIDATGGRGFRLPIFTSRDSQVQRRSPLKDSQPWCLYYLKVTGIQASGHEGVSALRADSPEPKRFYVWVGELHE